MTDRTLLCGDCGKEFVFTVAEQEFFKERGFDHDPKRCVECRRSRRRRFKSRQPRSGASDREGRGPAAPRAGTPRPDRSARPSADQSPGPPPTMHTAVCSSCGCETQVPFEPDGVRPVFCMPCLKQRTR